MTAAPTEPTGAGGPDLSPVVTVYWRPGCPFCGSLRRGLARSGLATREADIWADPTAAAFVRAHTGGDETVPTVDVGGTVLVNPSARFVLEQAEAAGIAVPPRRDHWWRRSGG